MGNNNIAPMAPPTNKLIFTLCSLLLTIAAAGQSVTVKLALQVNGDSTGNHVFRVTVKNNRFERYYVQDTTIIQSHRCFLYQFSMTTDIERKSKGKYELVDDRCSSGDPAPDQCLLNCCTCVRLLKGDQVHFDVKLIDCCTLTKGNYRVRLRIFPITIPADAGKDEDLWFKSNYVDFSIP